jgi:hypothetical protein
MRAGISSEDPIFVLQTDQVDFAGVEKTGGFAIRRHVVFGNLKSHPRRIGIGRLRVVDGYYLQFCRPVFTGYRIAQIGCEGCNSTLPRKMVPDNRYADRECLAGRRSPGRGRHPSKYGKQRFAPHQGIRVRICGDAGCGHCGLLKRNMLTAMNTGPDWEIEISGETLQA